MVRGCLLAHALENGGLGFVHVGLFAVVVVVVVDLSCSSGGFHVTVSPRADDVWSHKIQQCGLDDINVSMSSGKKLCFDLYKRKDLSVFIPHPVVLEWVLITRAGLQ